MPRAHAKQCYKPTLSELLSKNPVVVLGTVRHIGTHNDPDLNRTYDTVTIELERILKHERIENPYVDGLFKEGSQAPVMFPKAYREKYDIGTRAIWIIRYYNNTFWIDDDEVLRSADTEDSIKEIIQHQEKDAQPALSASYAW